VHKKILWFGFDGLRQSMLKNLDKKYRKNNQILGQYSLSQLCMAW